MCSISAIRLNVFILSYIKISVAVYFFCYGVYIGSYRPIGNAFGKDFTAYGGGLAMLGLMSGSISIPLRRAMTKHDKFLLVCCFLIDTLAFVFLIYLGNIFYRLTIPLFPKELQIDCSRYIRQTYSYEECLPFYDSPRTAGFRLFWENYYTRKANSLAFQVLSYIQNSGSCCGYFAPLQCHNNTSPFPSYLSEKGIASKFLTQRVTCGYYPNFYAQQSDCTDYYNEALSIVGGCNYDLGVSYCLTSSLNTYSLGCAPYVEEYASKLIGPHGIAIMVLSGFNMIMMIYSCCMWWKRKESDVFPDFTQKKGTINYFRVRDQFQIHPSEGLLTKEGFLPNNTYKNDKSSKYITNKPTTKGTNDSNDVNSIFISSKRNTNNTSAENILNDVAMNASIDLQENV